MVRVISVHNFAKQEITSVDDPISVATVPPDILLLALSNNTILVRDLLQINDPGYTVPTVDQAIKIDYSVQGNFIASLESKVTRNGTKVSYTRVYVNWESLKNEKETFPMRARIAGRVTPLSQNQKGLEMIEIPNQYMPENVSCCPVSGNLLVSSRNILNVYLFVTQTHDISKIHFIDFKQLTFDIHISFKPTKHQIIEDMIAVQNDEFIHIFRIKSVVPLSNVTGKEVSLDDMVADKIQPNNQKPTQKYKTIYYEKLLKELEEMKYPLLMDGAEEMQRKLRSMGDAEERELTKLSPASFPVRKEFPTILLEKTLSEFKGQELFRQNPFVPAKDLIVDFVSHSSGASNTKNQYRAINLCQYRLVPLTLGTISNCVIQEKFSYLILKPYYSNEKVVKKVKHHLLESDHFTNLKTIACFFGTQQEGYLQCFEYNTNDNEESVTCENYLTYAFTAPVFDVQLDDCFLHAITEVGLETYTLRAAKHLMITNDTSACPSTNDPVCLIGLHPFVNVLRLSMTTSYLTLFANNEESCCTLYQLQTPDTAGIWKDFLAAAGENKWEAPSTYCEMLGEGHLILKTKLKTVEWISRKDSSKNFIFFANPRFNVEELETIKSLYKESCALLGDYHLLTKNYQTSYSYYTMSGLKVVETSKRIRNLRDSIPEVYRENYSAVEITKGLIFFLKKTLSYYDQKYYDFTGNREEFYNPEIGNLVNNLMDLLEQEDQSSISDLVLDSVVLREFSTDRILKTLKSILSKSSVPQERDALSLALMCIQRDQSEQAKTVLLTMSARHLENLLLQYHDLLFSSHNSGGGINTFTELSMILIEIYPNVLARVLSDLVTEKTLLSLSKVLKTFMEIIPTHGSRLKNSSKVLQIVLENYFKYYVANFDVKKLDYKKTEALKILIRIYLSQLQQQQQRNGDEANNNKENDFSSPVEEMLFYRFRPNYLNQVPPFGPELKQMFQSEVEGDAKTAPNYQREKVILLKIQCILSFCNLPKECILEVRNYVASQANLYGSLSLKLLTADNMQEAIRLMIDFAPKPLGQFSKDRVKEKEDWKFLVTELLKKMEETKDDERLQFLYRQILSEILHHIVEHLNIEDIVEIIPEDYEEAARYFALAQNYAQADHLKTLIMITGKQLLASM